MRDIELIDDPAVAAAALDPIRSRLLAELATPGSAANLAARVGLPRQKVNYHLRALEERGLVEVAEERRHGGLTERVLRATAASYIVSPAALGRRALASRYLIALAARMLREVAQLDAQQDTLGLDAEIRFATPDDRAAFAEELTEAVTRLVGKYHDDAGRPHRLVVATHPIQEAGSET
ncbi:helix-turn-helix domain-containing protein [Solirubrobacter phytolaccae]|uniref:Helix-turn-helix domain-containing protein n=1 Tax=Solirubrobacter phytolaccae TaxID=1404360 RepID=A0A9X3S633_9ACTN|nr:helix-turn-helix domain-containing protein [Solirubrobacter phytolaccae]MDA0179599.1 helix-turn-helix domain-containing protein [Solirubrobacter phytolaccae]